MKTGFGKGAGDGENGQSETCRGATRANSPGELQTKSRLNVTDRIDYLQKLTSEFSDKEMRRDFLTEAAFFFVIVLLSAWPMISMVERMAKTFP